MHTLNQHEFHENIYKKNSENLYLRATKFGVAFILGN